MNVDMRRYIILFLLSFLILGCSFAQHSVLSTGKWYKVGVAETGIQRLTYSDLVTLGMDPDQINPKHLRVYHNGGGVLGEKNTDPHFDDLKEVPIVVYGEEDGKFDRNDYVLFYARGPVTWYYDRREKIYRHRPNAYEDYSYAFITADLGVGRRVAVATEPSGTADAVVSEFADYQLYDIDNYNIINSGRTYYSDIIEGNGSLSRSFTFKNAKTSRGCKVAVNLAGRNFNPASFQLSVNNALVNTFNIQQTASGSNNPFAHGVSGIVSGSVTGDVVKVVLTHVGVQGTTSLGYVDYVAVNAWRGLGFQGPEMRFQNPEALDEAKVYQYQLSGASSSVQVWDVTDSICPMKINGHLSGSVYSFKVNGNVDNGFIAFDGSSYHSPVLEGALANQDLHGDRNYDYLMVVYPDFLEQAERLKSIHAVYDPDLKVKIVTPQMIYNEFSCGAQDVTAIREYCKLLYGDARPLRYLLLFGDASFDYKNRSGVVNFVPAYETVRATDIQTSIVTDDYYGFMDEYEGSLHSSRPDIGVGRFPVSSLEEATWMVDKVENYLGCNESSMQPWRNVITFMCDDAESNEFFRHSEGYASQIKSTGGERLVVDKIYLDAYNQENTPSGQMAPEMNMAIDNRMDKGTLILNYVGHGGEVQLAEERILQKKDVSSWRNGPKYPLMITGTCEFSRYDDHTRTSLGEYAFLNQYGGMVAMFTTSRVTYGSDNLTFITAIYNHLFDIVDGKRIRLGDVYRMAKTTGYETEKRYVFFGDPALRLPMPIWSVETTHIDDTIRALQPVTINGMVKDAEGQLASSFNGVVHVSVYDKASVCTTKGDEGVAPQEFLLHNSLIFNGKTEVVNGRFSINFIVPRDISYRFGQGMISYYATDYVNEASGLFEDFIIGGFDDDAVMDNTPPNVDLFIDDELFVDGGIAGDSPILIANVEDESGINTTGAGIGHDIVATLSGPSNNTYVLNDYFVSDMGYQGRGVINYRMQNLAEGDYELTLKVWDIYNNSSTATVHFTVAASDRMVLDNPICFPNPFKDETCFSFDHNQIGNNMDVVIQIYDIMGRLVTELREQVAGTSARTNPIPWNGHASDGRKLSPGIYVYRIVAINDQKETSWVTSKLVITR